MFVNQIPFLVSKSAHIGHYILVPLKELSTENYEDALQVMIYEYEARGAKIKNILADGAFRSLKPFILRKNMDLDNPTAQAHIPQAERCIRDLKNRIRCARMMMPYTKVPRGFTIAMVKQVTIIVSSLVRKDNNINPIMSPRKLVTGLDLKLPTAQMGQFVQAHTGGSNSIEKEWTNDGLYIGRTDNGKHGHLVFKLSTRKVITCNKIDVIPLTQDIIERINEIGKQDHQPDSIVITNRSGNITVLDIDKEDETLDKYEVTYSPEEDTDKPSKREEVNDERFIKSLGPIHKNETMPMAEEQSQYFGGNNEGTNKVPDNGHIDSDGDVNHEDGVVDNDDEVYSPIDEGYMTSDNNQQSNVANDDTTDHNDAPTATSNDLIGNVDPEQPSELDNDIEAASNVPNELRSELDGDYWSSTVYFAMNLDDHFMWDKATITRSNVNRVVLSAMKSFHDTEPDENKIKPDGSHASKSTPQFGFKKGLQMFGNDGWEATKKELDKNFLRMEAVTMLKKNEWKQKEYFNTLRYLMFLK